MTNNTRCVNPYLNLSVQPNGVVKPCCMSNLEFVTDSGKKFLNEASILEFWNSDKRKQMIADLDAGIKIAECSACWKEEDAGKDSKRIRDNKTYNNKELSPEMLPVVVDLSMGNLCNIKCRICSPWHSTPWVIEQAKFKNPENPKLYINHERWNTFKESFSYDNDYFWTDIVKLLPMAERFDFAGGEPFYIEKHWDIVKMCVENGWSKNQHIHYNTNGTIYPAKYIELLDQFKIVDIQVSSDGVKEKFEYLRHPAKWEVAENTINQLCAARDSAKSQWIIGVCLSISAFNVFNFFEMFEHYASKDISIYINVVHDHHGTRILPPELKTRIIERLNSFESKHKTIQWERERDMICKHLENAEYNEHDWREFWKELKARDNYRNESFEKTFPEYYNLMKDFLIQE